MSTAVIDTLLQSVVAPRPAEPPPRPGDDRGAFRPALDNALRGDPQRGDGAAAPTCCPPKLADGPADIEDDATTDEQALDQQGDATAETIEADPSDASGAGDGEESFAEDDGNPDAVEISEEAATAAAAAAAVIAEAGEQAVIDADVALQNGDGQVKALADAKQSGEQRPEQPLPTPTSESGAEAQANAAASQAEAVQIGDGLPAKVQEAKETLASGAETTHAADAAARTAKRAVRDDDAAEAKSSTRESSSGKTSSEPDDEAATEHDESRAAVAKVETPANDADDPQSADSAGRDGRRSTGASRTADAPQVAAADSSAKSQVKTSEPASVDPSAVHGAAPVAAASAPEPAAARVAASIARFSTGRTLPGVANRSDADGTGQVDRARFVGRVEGAIRTAQQRDGRVHVRLSPPELGSLRIELTMHNGALSAHLEAETPAARNLLLDNLPALRDRLAQQDIRVDRFDVDVRSDSNGSNQQQNAQDRPPGDPTAGQRDERRGRPATRPAPMTRGLHGGGAATSTDAALDVRV